MSVLFLTGLWLAAAPRIWRGESELHPSAPPVWWPFSVALWAGVARSFVALSPAFIVLFVLVGLADLKGNGSAAGDALLLAGAGVLVVASAVYGVIVLFNRPRFLVPPPWRDDPGAREQWRVDRQRRSRR